MRSESLESGAAAHKGNLGWEVRSSIASIRIPYSDLAYAPTWMVPSARIPSCMLNSAHHSVRLGGVATA